MHFKRYPCLLLFSIFYSLLLAGESWKLVCIQLLSSSFVLWDTHPILHNGANSRLYEMIYRVFQNKFRQHSKFSLISINWCSIFKVEIAPYSSLPNKRTCTPYLILTKLPPCTLLFGHVRLFIFGIWNFLSNI